MSSETSTPYTPASASTTVAENETVSLADKIKKYDTAKLIDFLRKEEDLGLSEKALKILETQEVAKNLADFAKKCKEKKLRSFFSYKTKADLEKVLQEDYKISSRDITLIPQFKPVTCPVDENSPEFKLCIDDILHRIRNMEPVVDSNEAIRYEYISTILHTALSLLKGLIITPQMKITGKINTGRVNYAIKKILDDLLEEIICITEGKQNQATMVSTGTDWYFILHSTEGIYSTSRTEYQISLTEDTLKDDTELRKNVKRVLEVIVGLLKDRAVGSEESATKKRRVKEIIKKK
ncbi:hypothetical protein RclHR1_28370005 [Rhizophagus clarus]|uniref:Uncharacterized protein n=1 Tax=Rhizophagus clarus TaxID=94130 RepID=A0A2Z6RJ86_9GLOM|nr:hypothetical protein RclHR1_28370005 [Rhizophagus clarus]